MFENCCVGQGDATEMLLWDYTVGRISILNFPAKICTGMCRALLCGDDSSHSQGQSGKRLSWPPMAIPYGLPHTRPLLVTPWNSATPWTRPQIPLGPSPSPTIRLLKKDKMQQRRALCVVWFNPFVLSTVFFCHWLNKKHQVSVSSFKSDSNQVLASNSLKTG